MRRLFLLSCLLAPITAAAVPTSLSHQGRMWDALGAPLTGQHDITIAIYPTASGGTALHTQTFSSYDFDNGYFTVQLTGVDPDDFQANDESWLGIAIDSNPELPRIEVNSVPYAMAAESAVSVDGGTVNATEIRVNGTTVIDSSGNIDWSNISNPPAGSDTLADLSCTADQIARFASGSWGCADDDDHSHDAGALTGGTVDINRLPVGTTTGTVAAGDHSHSAGDLQIGGGTGTCSSGTAGALRWDSSESELLVCDGTDWSSLHKNYLGTHASNPGADCAAILTANSDAPDGAYWIKPASWPSAPFITWCDMTTDGGGWTMVGKVASEDYDKDNGLLDGADIQRWIARNYLGDMSDLDEENALGPAYESVPFTDFMLMGLHDPSKKLAWRHPSSFANLSAVFTTTTVEKTTDVLVGSFKTLDYRPGCGDGAGPNATGPNFYGFNVYSDTGSGSGNLANGKNGGWCSALAGWGRDNASGGYTGGGLGAMCQGRSHQMGRHYWGWGDGCDAHDWSGGSGTFNTFYGHAFFVR